MRSATLHTLIVCVAKTVLASSIRICITPAYTRTLLSSLATTTDVAGFKLRAKWI